MSSVTKLEIKAPPMPAPAQLAPAPRMPAPPMPLPFQKIDLRAAIENDPPPRRFIFAGLKAGSVGALVAAGGTGKSYFALEAAVSVASGFDMLSLGIKCTGKVTFFEAEDPEDEIQARVHNIGQYLPRKTLDALYENLTINAINYRFDIEKEVHRVIEICRNQNLIVFDTLNAIHARDENSNSDMSSVISSLRYIANSTGAAVLFIHHISKISARDGENSKQQHAARGASAIIDNARWCGIIERASKSEADRIRMHDESRRGNGSYLKFSVCKNNYAALLQNMWYHQGDDGVIIRVEAPINTVNRSDESRNSKNSKTERAQIGTRNEVKPEKEEGGEYDYDDF